MKMSDKKKPVKTMPEGIWESSRPKADKNNSHSTPSTDEQGNGYPVNKQHK